MNLNEKFIEVKEVIKGIEYSVLLNVRDVKSIREINSDYCYIYIDVLVSNGNGVSISKMLKVANGLNEIKELINEV